jgi:glycosyltransferase involved in cell wall biosynthesis
MIVLHSESSLGWGGQEMRILADARGLVARGHEVVILCRPDSRIGERAESEGLTVECMPMSRARMMLDIVIAHGIIRRHRVRIVNTHSATDSWIAGIAGRLAGAKVVRTRHLSHPIRPGIAARLLYQRIPHAVVTVGGSIRRAMIEQDGFRPESIVSIPTGPDLARFDPDTVSADGVREELGIPRDGPIVTMVAMLRGMKGHLYLVDAAPAVLAQIPSVRFLLVGDLPSESPLKQMLVDRIRALGIEDRFIFAGLREDVPRLLAASDLLVLPSVEGEGVPQSVTQAMAMGLAVVATDVGSVSDALVDGETGILIPPRDPGAIADAIVRLLQDGELRSRMGAAGRRRVVQHMSMEATMSRTIELYEALLDGV